MTAGSLFKLRVVEPILDLLRQGVTADKISLSIALGITLGVIPILGSTTLLCFVMAAVLRLNLPAIQLINYLVYPLQLVLLIPFMKMGQWLFREKPTTLTLAQILNLTRQNVWHAIAALWTVTMHALVVWLVLGSLAAPILYWMLAGVLRRLDPSPQVEPA